MKTQVDIVATSIRTAAGKMPAALFAATGTNLLTAEQNEAYSVKNVDREDELAFLAPIDEHYNEPFLQRISQFLLETLDELSPRIQDENKTLVSIVIPPILSARMRAFSDDVLLYYFKNNLPLRFEADMEVVSCTEGVSRHLAKLCDQLMEQEYHSIIFCGIDSMINPQTLNELDQQNLLLTTNAQDGFILGEAAAAILLRPPYKNQTRLARIRNIQHGIETSHPDSDVLHFQQLQSLFDELLLETKTIADKVHVVIYPTSSMREAQYEWFQVKNHLYPMMATEQQRVAMMAGEIEYAKAEPPQEPEMLYTSVSLGNVGAATVPVNLAMACARYEFEYPPVKRIVVCESSEGIHRGITMLMP